MRRRIVAGVAIIAAAALTTSLFVFVFLVTPPASNRYIMHGPISIRGNDQFNGANGVTEGNGTSANPYVIQDWEINVNWANRISIRLRFSVDITVSGNHVSSKNAYGIYLVDSSGTLVLGNNLVNNTRQALEIRGNENSWDGGYPVGGNYWSDYTGQDNCTGPDQDMCP